MEMEKRIFDFKTFSPDNFSYEPNSDMGQSNYADGITEENLGGE